MRSRMTKEQITTIENDVHSYISQKAKETGASHNTVCIAITRATLSYAVEKSELKLRSS